MPNQNYVSITIPENVLQEIIKALNECIAKIAPYVVGLTPEERQNLLKMGDKSVAMVQKTSLYIESNPEYIPSYLNKEEFKKDEKLYSDLLPLLKLVEQLMSMIDNTALAAGSDSFQAALIYYNTVRAAAANGVPGAQAIYDDLAHRFARTTKKKTDAK